MASQYGTYNYGHSKYVRGSQNSFYVYGTAVRQMETFPERVPETRTRPLRKTRTSRQVIKNRRRAMSISPAYALFITAAAVCAVMICMLYLTLQADVVSRSKNVSALQEELAALTEANNTAYNSAADSVNLETVRDRAMNEMGMVYASQGTVVEYDSPSGDYVKQYSDIPESGVLAKSSEVSK